MTIENAKVPKVVEAEFRVVHEPDPEVPPPARWSFNWWPVIGAAALGLPKLLQVLLEQWRP